MDSFPISAMLELDSEVGSGGEHGGGGDPATGVAAGAAGPEPGNLGSASSGSFLLGTNVVEAGSLYSEEGASVEELQKEKCPTPL